MSRLADWETGLTLSSVTLLPVTLSKAHKISLLSIFQCPLQLLAAKLHISWNSVICSLYSLEDQLGVQLGTRASGFSSQLPLPIFPLPGYFCERRCFCSFKKWFSWDLSLVQLWTCWFSFKISMICFKYTSRMTFSYSFCSGWFFFLFWNRYVNFSTQYCPCNDTTCILCKLEVYLLPGCVDHHHARMMVVSPLLQVHHGI